MGKYVLDLKSPYGSHLYFECDTHYELADFVCNSLPDYLKHRLI